MPHYNMVSINTIRIKPPNNPVRFRYMPCPFPVIHLLTARAPLNDAASYRSYL